MRAGAIDRAQLRAEHVEMVQSEADAAPAEERIRLVRDAEIRRDLVAAEVHRAEDDRPRVHALGDLAIGFELLLLRRQRVAVQIEELGAEQSHAVRTRVAHERDVGRLLDVGAEIDRPAIQCHRALAANRLERRGLFLEQRAARAIV
jgi:hypothetical protein